jgi:hypothetical protein
VIHPSTQILIHGETAAAAAADPQAMETTFMIHMVTGVTDAVTTPGSMVEPTGGAPPAMSIIDAKIKAVTDGCINDWESERDWNGGGTVLRMNQDNGAKGSHCLPMKRTSSGTATPASPPGADDKVNPTNDAGGEGSYTNEGAEVTDIQSLPIERAMKVARGLNPSLRPLPIPLDKAIPASPPPVLAPSGEYLSMRQTAQKTFHPLPSNTDVVISHYVVHRGAAEASHPIPATCDGTTTAGMQEQVLRKNDRSRSRNEWLLAREGGWGAIVCGTEIVEDIPVQEPLEFNPLWYVGGYIPEAGPLHIRCGLSSKTRPDLVRMKLKFGKQSFEGYYPINPLLPDTVTILPHSEEGIALLQMHQDGVDPMSNPVLNDEALSLHVFRDEKRAKRYDQTTAGSRYTFKSIMKTPVGDDGRDHIDRLMGEQGIDETLRKSSHNPSNKPEGSTVEFSTWEVAQRITHEWEMHFNYNWRYFVCGEDSTRKKYTGKDTTFNPATCTTEERRHARNMQVLRRLIRSSERYIQFLRDQASCYHSLLDDGDYENFDEVRCSWALFNHTQQFWDPRHHPGGCFGGISGGKHDGYAHRKAGYHCYPSTSNRDVDMDGFAIEYNDGMPERPREHDQGVRWCVSIRYFISH